MRGMSLEGLDFLGIDETTNRLNWNGEELQTRQSIRLEGATFILAIAGTISAVVLAHGQLHGMETEIVSAKEAKAILPLQDLEMQALQVGNIPPSNAMLSRDLSCQNWPRAGCVLCALTPLLEGVYAECARSAAARGDLGRRHRGLLAPDRDG